MKYTYKGDEDLIYYDVTGKRYYLRTGDRVELKMKPYWDKTEDKQTKVKTKHDSSK